LRILAITHDRGVLRELRLEMPLKNLKKQGLIQDYFISDVLLHEIPNDYVFDALWLQRIVSPGLIEHVSKRTGGNFLYDADDLIPGNPSYVRVSFPKTHAANRAMEDCKVLSVTSNRLVGLLEEYTSLKLFHKAVVCPNGFDFPGALRIPEKPQGLIWTSGDYAALLHSKESIVNAVERFSRKYDLPVYCFGYLDNEVKARIHNTVDLGFASFWHYKALLASFPALIGVAPLETVAEKNDLDFINGKSDVKIVDFAGAGHPAAYSAAPPYVNTDLRCGLIVENNETDWLDRLETIYEQGWKKLDKEQSAVVEARGMDRLARECWYEAISRARLDRPIVGKVMKFSSELVPPVESPDELQRQIAWMQNSLSWRITGPLRRIRNFFS
jgi:hypothetical protein